MKNADAELRQLQLQVAELSGYLAAIAHINGADQEFVTYAIVLRLADANQSIEQRIQEHLAAWEGRQWHLLSMQQLASWAWIERRFFMSTFLTQPFGDPTLSSRADVVNTRYNLAWQATSAIDFLKTPSCADEPPPSYHMQLAEGLVHESSACALKINMNLVFIHSIHWRMDALKQEVADEMQKEGLLNLD